MLFYTILYLRIVTFQCLILWLKTIWYVHFGIAFKNNEAPKYRTKIIFHLKRSINLHKKLI